jgi:CheY-like chemotaxis protein
MLSGSQNWPVNRQFARFKLEAPIGVRFAGHEWLRGWCRNVGEGGACATLAARLSMGDTIELELKLPGDKDTLTLQAVVRHVNGMRYGLEFAELAPAHCTRIRRFGRKLDTAAYLLSSQSETVRELQHALQQIGIPKVSFGSPKVFPAPDPCLIVVDCEWPDYLEVMQYLRAEAGPEPVVIVALLSPEADIKQAYANGADLIVRKPVTGLWVKRVLATASNLLKKDTGASATETQAGLPPAKSPASSPASGVHPPTQLRRLP